MTSQKAKTLRVTASEEQQHSDAEPTIYTFEAYELPSGEVCVPQDGSDAWYANRDEVQANGNAIVVSVEETGRTVEWTQSAVGESVSKSAREYGKSAIPGSLQSKIAR